ncbi:hypothetical protein NFIA_091150 [Paecilomyces variotii No. 5]|uniref:LYC1 C-terminal domain-containing protein n=1 Tax=Byssochlamys spectabilis (strain No. 5 / NBRC 109023) TaxID=1356009 RepID=V5F7D5_BYSSN|nr:hypothetical protein NFIA_091150 [Paecilomyces variotii No. 5]
MGSIDTLPPADSPHLVLLPATPEERIEAIRLNSTAWKGPLDLQTYIAREDHLMNQKLTRGGALTCWVLVDSRQPEGQRTILSSCETFKKKALLAYNGKVEDILAQGIGSVYCRPEFRGKRYASRMIQELSKRLETWQLENEARKKSVFSVLFSDIGKNFYAQYGWKPFQSSHISLPPITKEQYNQGIPGANLPSVRDLVSEDISRCMCNDEVTRKEREHLRIASERSPVAKVAIAPDYDHFIWHWAREEFYVEQFYKKNPPTVKGAGVDGLRVYCAWTRNFGETPAENVLYILRWMYDEPTTAEEEQETAEAMAAVLRRAQLEATEWNMAQVDFWNPTPLMQKAATILDPSAEVIHREKSSIASLKWNGAEQGLGDQVEWFWNEKYTWC